MRLYHGSIEKVDVPEIRISNRTLDYGCGFYTTTSLSQAKDWVLRRLKESHSNHGYVNVFEYDENMAKGLDVLMFNQPTDEWVDFVMQNHTQKGFEHSHDIVYGPVANDRVYAAFALYEGGVLDKQNLIAELKTYKLVDQYLFHTKESLNTLTFIEAREVKV